MKMRLLLKEHLIERQVRAMHGTVRQLIASAITGLSTGFTKELELNGVGYSGKYAR